MPAMRTRQLIERRDSGGKPVGPRREGGHHVYCWRCGGWRTHAHYADSRGRLVARCRTCGEPTLYLRVGTHWVPQGVALPMAILAADVRKAREAIALRKLREFEDDAGPPGPGSSGEPGGDDLKGMGEPLAAETGKESGTPAAGPISGPVRHPLLPSGSVVIDGDGVAPLVDHEDADFPGRRPTAPLRARWKVAAVALAAPFAVMGLLTALAWRGVYVWPIYYAIQPYYRPWMNDWPFVSLSVAIPGLITALYALRCRRRPERTELTAHDVRDWNAVREWIVGKPKPERKTGIVIEARVGVETESEDDRKRPGWWT